MFTGVCCFTLDSKRRGSLNYSVNVQKLLLVAPCSSVAEPSEVSPISAFTVESLASLMVDAYEGTVDWEPGDDESVAASEIQSAIAGSYGSFLEEASGVLTDEQGNPVSALFSAVNQGRPTILFVYTAKQHSGIGLASRLIRNAAFQISRMGFTEISLFVSPQNPAKRLYEKLGFTET
jgi:ribosomal protein S18 acetylase RimI-like enzyme